MTDPVSKLEIENVLSSIRQLVGDDARPASDAASPRAPGTKPGPRDKLVLTPAQRVPEEETPGPEADASAEASPDAAEPSEDIMPEDKTRVAPVISRSRFNIRRPDRPTPPAETLPSADAPETASDTDTEAELPKADNPSRPPAWADLRIKREMTWLGPLDPGNATGDDAPSDSDTAEPDPDPVDPAPLDTSWLDPALPVGLSDMGNTPLEPRRDVQTPDSAAAAIEALTAKIALLEAELARSRMSAVPRPDAPEDYDPDEPPEEPTGAGWTTDETEDDSPAELTEDDARAEAEAALREAQEANADIFGTGETLLDEDSLRELVTDIVREELQGALGERITRNVRKLVRREIQRAFAAQDLD